MPRHRLRRQTGGLLRQHGARKPESAAYSQNRVEPGGCAGRPGLRLGLSMRASTVKLSFSCAQSRLTHYAGSAFELSRIDRLVVGAVGVGRPHNPPQRETSDCIRGSSALRHRLRDDEAKRNKQNSYKRGCAASLLQTNIRVEVKSSPSFST